MTNETFKDIEKLESDLWEAADNLRANSKLTSSDYFMPVLGVIFLRNYWRHRGKIPVSKAKFGDGSHIVLRYQIDVIVEGTLLKIDTYKSLRGWDIAIWCYP